MKRRNRRRERKRRDRGMKRKIVAGSRGRKRRERGREVKRKKRVRKRKEGIGWRRDCIETFTCLYSFSSVSLSEGSLCSDFVRTKYKET